jgi:hypothetical protein
LISGKKAEKDSEFSSALHENEAGLSPKAAARAEI